MQNDTPRAPARHAPSPATHRNPSCTDEPGSPSGDGYFCDPHLYAIIRYALDSCPFGIAIYGANHRLVFANAVFYSFLKLSPTVFPVGSAFEDIVEFMIRRGDIMGEHKDCKSILAEQIELARHDRPCMCQRSGANGDIMAITGWPRAEGGFVRTYFDASFNQEKNWEMRARIRLLRRRVQDLEFAMRKMASTVA